MCRVLRVIVYSLGFLVVVHFSADHTWVQMFYTTCHDFPGYIFFELSGIPGGFLYLHSFYGLDLTRIF